MKISSKAAAQRVTQTLFLKTAHTEDKASEETQEGQRGKPAQTKQGVT